MYFYFFSITLPRWSRSQGYAPPPPSPQCMTMPLTGQYSMQWAHTHTISYANSAYDMHDLLNNVRYLLYWHVSYIDINHVSAIDRSLTQYCCPNTFKG